MLAVLCFSLLANAMLVWFVYEMGKQPNEVIHTCDTDRWRDISAAQHRGLQRQSRKISRLKTLLAERVKDVPVRPFGEIKMGATSEVADGT